MKKPIKPPEEGSIWSGITEEIFLLFVQQNQPVDDKGRYIHWDKLRYLTPPTGLTSEQWWLSIKQARRALYKPFPLDDLEGKIFKFALPDEIQRQLHWLDRYAAGSIQASEAITNKQSRNTYLIRSLVEEAINSSQLEGASTTRDVAKEMIRQSREPEDLSERMILNNYRAMQFIRDIKEEPLTPAIVFELHRILTEDTLDKPDAAGQFRKEEDDIHVVDETTNEYLHTPPSADELPERLQRLCDFANESAGDENNSVFMHPIVRAIGLHFALAYDHPFYDGNGRTARALFYWAMAKDGYWLMEFISISEAIKKAPVQYGRAFLLTETDDNDLTYFLLHQLGVIHQAVESLHAYLDEKAKTVSEVEQALENNSRLKGRLNFRQLALLRHALKNPRFTYVVHEHKQSHGVSYDVARTDLLFMADTLGLLDKSKKGRQYYFVSPMNLAQRIKKN